MDRYERILTLHRIFQSHRLPVGVERLREELDCS
ncbi:MAG TPA: transcriptional regulator, partial [Rhodanobacteraceae bacterium]|nr:transcriptional regulator [Rhodanobacteraceae bacterium]